MIPVGSLSGVNRDQQRAGIEQPFFLLTAYSILPTNY